MKAAVRAIDYYLPEHILGNDELAAKYADWTAEKIKSKTGISTRHIAAPEECSSDLAIAAAKKLFASSSYQPSDFDFLLLCTQSPDFFLPTTACIVQEKLGLPQTAGALDFNLGCSGFVYGLGLAKGLIESGQAKRLLLITAETYSKFIHEGDKSVRTIFGDAAAATVVEAVESEGRDPLGPFVYGTDGRGWDKLIVPTGGMREQRSDATAQLISDESGNTRTRDNLFMNGPEIFTFTLRVVPASVQQLMEKAGVTEGDIDLFVFHQANEYMLEHLRKKMKVPAEKFVVSMADCGNTVSATIPIALRESQKAGRIKDDALLLLSGFGVGYSWAATLMRWLPA